MFVVAVVTVSMALFHIQVRQARAATYYVDSVGGNDSSATPTSSSTPWQTIAKVNGFTFSAGDSILFKSGDTWRETLTPPTSGSAGSPIIFGSYGGATKPIISGSDIISSSSWSVAGTSYVFSDSLNSICSGSDPYWGTCSGGVFTSSTAVVAPGDTGSAKINFTSSGQSGAVNGSVTSTAIADLQFELNVASMTASAGATAQLKGITQSSGGMNLATPIINWQSSSTYTLSLAYYADGSHTLVGTTVLSTNTWHTIELQYVQSASAGGAALWIDGVGEVSGFTNNSSGYAANQIRIGLFTSSAGFTAATFYLNNVKYNTAYIGIPLPNTYVASVSTQPNAVWIDGASLGAPVSAPTNLSNQNQWYWNYGTLYIYSASNPSSGSHTVEAADRANTIFVNQVNYITLDGLEAADANDRAVYLRNCTNAVLQNMKIHDSVNQDIIAGVGGGSHTIQNSEIYNSGINSAFGGGNGIQMQNLTTSSTIQNNYIHDIGLNLVGGSHAVYDQVGGDIDRFNHFKNVLGGTGMKTDGAGILIYGNLFDSIPSGGIYIDPYSNVKVYNNTFYNNGTISPYASILFVGDGAESGVEAKNNIIYVSSGYSVGIVVQTNATGFSSDHNDVFGAWFGEWPSAGSELNLADWKTTSGQDSNSTSGDPKFTNSAGGAFSLASSSPAIDAGVDLGTTYDMGLDPASTWPSSIILDNQNSFGAGWEMGAYVYTQASTPSVAMTAPTANSTVSGTISVSASSTAVSPASIASVQFYLDGSPLGSVVTSSPYTISWNTGTATNASHTLYALATDNYSNTATSTSITVTVANQAVLSVPTSTLSFSAVHGSTATSSQSVVVKNAGATSTTLNWSASSTQTWLTFSLTSGSLSGNATTSVSFIVNPATLALGTYNATATISDPNASSSPQTIPVTLTISSTGASATITAPVDGTTLSGNASITASATSTVSIASLSLLIDGSPVASTTTSSLSYSWDTTQASNGTHTISVLATDTYNNSASSSISVTVSNAAPSTTPSPVVEVAAGGGGGSGYTPAPVTTTSTPPAATSSMVLTSTPVSTSSLQAQLDMLLAELQALEAKAGITTNASSSYTFTRNLTIGSKGSDVEALQHYLNTHGFPVNATPTYAGSLGYETQYFGKATQTALAEFQKSVGISPAVGFFGPITRAYVNGQYLRATFLFSPYLAF